MANIKDRKKYHGSNIINYGGRWLYWLTPEETNGKYKGYYNFTEMAEFPECEVDFTVLRTRLQYYRYDGSTPVEQIWNCVTRPLHEPVRTRKIVEDKDSIEMSKLMKLWPTIGE